MDRLDGNILAAVQADSSLPLRDLAEKAGLSQSACHRRLRALEQQGVIRGYMARLDPGGLGLNLLAFVEISLENQRSETMERFEKAAASFDSILECHFLSGSPDYILRVAAESLDQYDHIQRTCLARLPGVSVMRTSFSIRRIKEWSGYPVPARF